MLTLLRSENGDMKNNRLIDLNAYQEDVDDEAGVAEILVCDSKGGTSRTANVLSVLFFIYICFFSHC
jgi:hypothetical protein